MIELIPNECDEPSIFLCGMIWCSMQCNLRFFFLLLISLILALPFCEFRGVGPELLEHCSSIVHLRGFLDVYGLLEDANNNDIFASCKFLYDGNISHYGKDPTRLIKRVFHTFDYNNAKRGRYPVSNFLEVTSSMLLAWNILEYAKKFPWNHLFSKNVKLTEKMLIFFFI